MTIARPAAMRGALISQITKNMVLAGVIASAGAGAWWYFVCRDRKIAYDNFHKNLDVDKMYNRIKSKGVFTFTKAIEDAEE